MPSTALARRRQAAALARGLALLLAVYLATYFYAPPRALPRLVGMRKAMEEFEGRSGGRDLSIKIGDSG